MEKIINYIQKNNKIIILILILGIMVLVVSIQQFISKESQIPEQTPSPLSPTTTIPTIEPQYISPYPTIPPSIKPDLQYPVNFKSITVEFKPRSGTFLIYYNGPIQTAQDEFEEFMNRLSLSKEDYPFEYRSLEPISLPPAYNLENEN